ncbi:hypothetical protein D3C78_1505700 [compost metagenome]
MGVGLDENRVVVVVTIWQQRAANQSRAVLAIRAFTIVGNIEAGHHSDAIFPANLDDLLHKRADLAVVNLLFVYVFHRVALQGCVR